MTNIVMHARNRVEREMMGRTSLLQWMIEPIEGYTARCRRVKPRVGVVGVLACLCGLLAAAAAFAQNGETPADDTVFLNRILFSGNEHVSDSELRGRMRTKEPSVLAIFRKPGFDRRQLERDLAALQAYYHTIGFPQARVTLARVEYIENDRFVNLHVKVDEGSATRVRTVVFAGDLLMEESKLRKVIRLKEGSSYNAASIETDVFKIKGEYFNLGYLGVTVDDSVRVDGQSVDIRYTIDPGIRLMVGEITIEGNRDVRTSVIEQEIEIESGEVCRFDKVLKTQRNLFETRLFALVDVVPENIDPIERTVDIRIRVRERKASWIEAGFGVGNLLGSRVFAEWGTRNLVGTGRTVRLKAEYAFDLFEGEAVDFNNVDVTNTFERYDVIFAQRRVFGIKLGAGLNGYIEEDRTVPDLEVVTLGTAIGVTHEFSRYSEVLVAFSLEDITRRQTGLPEEKSNSHILGVSLDRDTRNFILNPTVGIYRVFSTEVAGGVLGGDNDFYKVTATNQRYHPRGQKVLAWRVRVGYGDSYGRSDEIPVESRYFLGGANSVRGYDDSGLGPRFVDDAGNERVRGGEFTMLVNVEYRYPFPFLARWNFSGALFLDSGNVWESARDLSADNFKFTSDVSETVAEDYRYSVGVGIRYNTPVGPIRLDWGYPLKPDVYTDTHGSFYLSLGQIF